MFEQLLEEQNRQWRGGFLEAGFEREVPELLGCLISISSLCWACGGAASLRF